MLRIVALLALIASPISPSSFGQGQFALTPVSTFGSNGWLAPNGVNGSTYTYMTTGDTERGLAYGNSHLYLVSRNGGDFVRILDPQTGNDLGALNLGSGIVTGGTFNVNMVAVGEDGAIYVANLEAGTGPFRIYRWANDLAGTLPTVVYSAQPLTGARLGDSLAAIGNGSSTRLAAGFNNMPSVSGNNGYAIIDPTAGTGVAVGFADIPPNPGDFRLAIGFIDPAHVIGTQGGSAFLYTSFSGAAGTLLASPALLGDERPMAFAKVGDYPLLAALGTADGHLSVYNMADITHPALVGQTNATTGALPANTHNTGAVAWGKIQASSATVYALGTSGGIEAFALSVPAPVAPVITSGPQSQTVAESSAATFTVTATGSPSPTFQWYKNDLLLQGATNSSYTISSVQLVDDGSRFKVVASNKAGSQTSSDAILRVTADTTPPLVQGVQSLGTTQVRIVFSERVDSATATNTANYRIGDGVADTVPLGATLDDTQTTVTLTVSLQQSAVYTLTINGVKDQSVAGNVIAANTQVSFNTLEYTPLALGGASEGAVLAVDGGYDLRGGGADIGGTRDQFEFGYKAWSGDFDFKVRLADLTITDPYVKAGLMVREVLTDSSRFAGVFASSAQLGCFFESRATASGAATVTGPGTKFPASFPWIWLRLQRSGNDFNGYGSFDGKAWQRLGTVNLGLPAQIFLGMAVTSDNTSTQAVAKFRELGTVENPASFTYLPKREPLGPSNRRTGVIFSEIMYHPPDRTDGKNLEFVEIYNAEPYFVNLTGWKISGGIDFSFPDNFQMQAGQFVVVAADPAALQSIYGIQGVLGPYQRKLGNNETLRLLNQSGAVRAELTYDSEPPWPPAADGAGHSLVMLKPSYGENDPRAWGQSQLIGGSPGQDDPIVPHPWSGVVINEFLANAQNPDGKFLELYNASANSVDLSGCFLSNSPNTNKFRIPDGTTLAAQRWISFNISELGFDLKASGDTLFLVSADQSRVLDAVLYGAQEEGVSFGRVPDGAPVLRRLANVTPAAANSTWRSEDIVINEIMYKSVTLNPDDQYIELYNRSAKSVDLSGWRFSAGVNFSFPAGASIPAGGYVVLAKNVQRMLANYPQLNANNTFGDFSGKLGGNGDHVALAKPAQLVSINSSGVAQTNIIYITTTEVAYGVGGRWPELADGEGSSLEFIDSHADPLLAYNWAGSDETQKAAWASFEATGKLDLANQSYLANKLYVISLGAEGGEYLLDDIEVFRVGSTNIIANAGFESGTTGWGFYGNHTTSRIESSGGASGPGCLHLRATGQGDEANNSVRGNLSATLTASQVVTIRAKARWVSGWPELLLRVRGNGVELPIVLQPPANLGSPGLPNSRRAANAGPAISEVTHFPPVPAATQAVVVSARVSDPDGLASLNVVYRTDPGTSSTSVSMRDDGTGGDALAGDGIYSATISGRASGTLVAFHIEARDNATTSVSTLFPNNSPIRECLIRWGDPLPFGSFAHYHMWFTAASEADLTSHSGLDNKFRDCTIVYNNNRVIYNSGYRNKGSPFHGGLGSYTGKFPPDDLLVGSDDHIYRTTGNGGTESTEMADDMALWMAGQMGVPALHSHYIRLYRNGAPFNPINYDIEYPNRSIAKDWFGGGGLDDTLYKIAVWFEYDDSNGGGTGSTIGATFQKKPATAPPFKPAAYRWNWQPHPGGRTANDYSLIFNLVSAANSSDKVTQLTNLADMEEWMRLWAWERVMGNWDSWSYSVGQNMYIYTPLGERARLIPWDIDFVLGLGDNATTSQLFSAGEDGVVGNLFNVPAFKRMMCRAYLDAVNGPLRKEISDPQFDGRRAALTKNGISATLPTSLKSYVAARRTFIQNQIRPMDAAAFSITTQGFTSATPTASITGLAPFAVASIEINGVPYPVSWSTITGWTIKVPLAAATNVLSVVGKDRQGKPVAGATGQITVKYAGAVPQPQDWVVMNEIMYNASVKNAEFVELYNRNPDTAFDLSGVILSGAAFTFAPGTFIQPNGYLLVVRDSASFAAAYGATIPIAGEYSGKLQNDGETLRLIKPGATPDQDLVIDEVRYENTPPWPNTADGQGPSLQLIDPSQDNWRAGNWTVTATNDVNRATPGRANAVRNTIDPFPLVWINEILSNNQRGLQDENGERDPWIELYNSGSTTLDLSSYYLSDDPSKPTLWQFPAGSSLDPGKFLLLWADGQPEQTTPTALHTNFRLDPTNGVVLLNRIQLGVPAAMDYVNYSIAEPDQTIGSIPDGDPRNRRLLFFPTPAAANDPNGIIQPIIEVTLTAGNTFVVNWVAQAGVKYRVQATEEIGSPNWQDVFERIADSTSLSFEDQSPMKSERYYRVVAE